MSINGVDIIYWINLDTSIDRRKNMENVFRDDSFRSVPIIKRFSAVNGSDSAIVNNMLQVETKSISDREYACLLSHMAAIKEFSESPHQLAIIMEDDVTLDYKPHWDKDLNTIIDDAPPGWDIIMLAYISNDIPPEDYTFNENKYWSALSYVINKNAAIKLTNEVYKNGKYHIETTINNEADQYIFVKLKTYVYKYPLFTYKYDENSTLHQSAIPFHNLSRKRTDDLYKVIVEQFTTQCNNLYCYANNNRTMMIYIIIFIVVIFIIILYCLYNPNIFKKYMNVSMRKLMKYFRLKIA